MKFLSSLVLFVVLLAAGCSGSPSTPSTANAEADTAPSVATAVPDLWTMTVEGMSCATNCAPTVAKAIQGLAGVQKAEVDFEAKQARVETEAGTELTVAMINKSFDNQGYFVESLEKVSP